MSRRKRPKLFAHRSSRLLSRVQKPVLKKTLVEKLPTELWDNVKTYLSPHSTGLLRKQFRFTSTQKQSHEEIWYQIFKDEKWLNYVVNNNGHPGLLLVDQYDHNGVNTQLAVLLLHNFTSGPESKKLFFKSAHRWTQAKSSPHRFLIGRKHIDLRVLFQNNLYDISELHTLRPELASYFFFTDTQRKCRRVEDRRTYRGEVTGLYLPFTHKETGEEELARFALVDEDDLPIGRRHW